MRKSKTWALEKPILETWQLTFKSLCYTTPPNTACSGRFAPLPSKRFYLLENLVPFRWLVLGEPPLTQTVSWLLANIDASHSF